MGHGNASRSEQINTARAGLGLTLSLLLLYLAADMVSMCMSLDGVIYGAVAQLLAQGQGSVWALPHFEFVAEAFADHPPFGLWLFSLWAQVLGSAFWVDRSFLLLLIGLMWWGMILLARPHFAASQQGSEGALPNQSWWPLLVFFSMPVVTFALKNNVLESLVAVFTLWAVVFAWWGQTRSWLNLITGILCCAAVFSKGPVGLFPLVAPACFALLLQRDGSKVWRHSLLASAPVAFAFVVVYLFEPSRISLLAYLDQQIYATFTGVRSAEYGRLYLVGQFAINIAVALVLVILISRARLQKNLPKAFWAYLAIGLCAFVPLLLSPRQYRHYLLSCLPYFALCFSLLGRPSWPAIKAQWLWSATVLVALAAIVRATLYFGQPGEDQLELEDINVVAAQQGGRQVGFCQSYLQRRAYLARYPQLKSYVLPVSKAQTLSPDMLYVCADNPGGKFVLVADLNEGLKLWQRTSS